MQKIHVIQYLRALAALAVVGVHASWDVGAALPSGISQMANFGHAGVDLFFVISGFIMWSISVQGREMRGYEFFLRRCARLVPLYWGATLLWAGAAMVGVLGWVSVSGADMARSLLFLPYENPDHGGRLFPILVPGWTLNYEMFFYAIFALVLGLRPQWRLLGLCAVMGALVLAGMVVRPTGAMAMFYTSALLLEFLAGCLVAVVWVRVGISLRWGLVALAGAALTFALLAPGVATADHTSRALGFGLPSALLVAGAVGIAPKIPYLSVLDRMGDASFSTYLFHPFLLAVTLRFWGADITGPVEAVAYVLGCLVGAILLGWAIYHWVERPMLAKSTAWLSSLLSNRAGLKSSAPMRTP